MLRSYYVKWRKNIQTRLLTTGHEENTHFFVVLGQRGADETPR